MAEVMGGEYLQIADPSQRALAIADAYGSVDGGHHKMWVIDQMVRALTSCPIVVKMATYDGKPYSYEDQGESAEYLAWVIAFCAGEDGPQTYAWDVGVAP